MNSARSTSLRAIQRQFDRRAPAFAQHDFLFREAEVRMLERLDVVRIAPARVLDLGCGPGRMFAALARRFPQARLAGVDVAARALAIAARAWRRPRASWWSGLLGRGPAPGPDLVQASFAHLPFRAAAFDLLVSNLALHFASDPLSALREWARVTAPGGLVMFSCFGPDTLKEIRAFMPHWSRAPAVLPFADMHDLGDMLLDAGYAQPVVDMEMLTLTYTDAGKLLADLRAVTGNPLTARAHGLTGRARLAQLQTALDSLRGSDGLLRVTIELVQGHAWRAPAREAGTTTRDGMQVVHIPVDHIGRGHRT